MNTTYLDTYCERAGEASLLAEPLNAITNLAFIFASILAIRLLRRFPSRQIPDAYVLAVTLFCIGLGSGAWHLHPTSTTIILDVLPIIAFINLYLITFLYRAFHWRWWMIAMAVIVLQALNAVSGMIFSPGTLHGTIMYLPTYLILALITAYSFYRRDWFAIHLLLITLLWTLSLVFRTIDLPFCNAVGFGTHYLWHLANAAVLYKLLTLLLCIVHRNRTPI